VRLTARNAEALRLPPGKRDHIEFDDRVPGFGLRIREGGGRTWVYQYSIGTKQRRITLGKATAITADTARALASDLHARTRLGADVAAQKALSKAQASNSFGKLVKQYLEFQQSNLRPRSFGEVERHLEFHAKSFHGLPVDSIDRRAIADRLNAIAKGSGDVAANRVRASLSAMFAWALREGLASANPTVNTSKRQERPRDRVLSDVELRMIWSALEDDDYAAIIKLLMLTGQRAAEIGGLRWSEIQDDMIVLPGERVKNGRTHLVPLSPEARAILDAMPHRSRDRIFGQGDQGFSGGWSRFKAKLDARICDIQQRNGHDPVKPFVVHDLRRSVATKMAEDLKIAPHVVEAVLNHVSGHKGGIAGIYNRASYFPERKQALQMWGAHLLAVVEGRKSNITSLKRPA
jgi:integrase